MLDLRHFELSPKGYHRLLQLRNLVSCISLGALNLLILLKTL